MFILFEVMIFMVLVLVNGNRSDSQIKLCFLCTFQNYVPSSSGIFDCTNTVIT